MDLRTAREALLELQAAIVAAFEHEDGGAFATDAWQRPAGGALEGDGITRVIEAGHVLERGGCNFSHVRGPALPASATLHRPELAGAPFEALGVSLVFHPHNPHVPTAHMNVRLLQARPEGEAPVTWFGGGMDLTPCYGVEDDVRHFHRTCRTALDTVAPGLYPTYKRWCDEYFYLRHRREARGVGGIFFDDVADRGFGGGMALILAVGRAFVPAYLPIVQARRATPYGAREREFQALRRGRYVEFNLVWDRGTHFGLHGDGRAESVLMSMPPVVQWRYDWHPEPGTPEARLWTDFLPVKDWI